MRQRKYPVFVATAVNSSQRGSQLHILCPLDQERYVITENRYIEAGKIHESHYNWYIATQQCCPFCVTLVLQLSPRNRSTVDPKTSCRKQVTTWLLTYTHTNILDLSLRTLLTRW